MKPFFDSSLPHGGDHVISAPAAILLGIGLIVSVVTAQTIQSFEVRRETADFHLAAEQTIGDIGDRINTQIELIRSIFTYSTVSSG